jgi:hypothetical protein
VRRVLEFGETIEYFPHPRWKQLGRTVRFGKKDIFLAGSYEQDCGGCDTIKDVELIFTTLLTQVRAKRDIVFEGLFVLNHMRGIEFAKKVVPQTTLDIIHLVTTLEQCQASINERRARQGKAPWTRWRNVENSIVRARNFASKLEAEGATVHHVGRDEAAQKLADLLGLKVKVPPFTPKARTGVLF